MTTFRKTVATTIGDRVDSHTWDTRNGLADAVLAMPEMQAIRRGPFTMANIISREWLIDGPRDALKHEFALPADVVDWVMGDA